MSEKTDRLLMLLWSGKQTSVHDCCASVLKVKQQGRTKADQRSNGLSHLHTDQRHENKTEEKKNKGSRKSWACFWGNFCCKHWTVVLLLYKFILFWRWNVHFIQCQLTWRQHCVQDSQGTYLSSLCQFWDFRVIQHPHFKRSIIAICYLEWL